MIHCKQCRFVKKKNCTLSLAYQIYRFHHCFFLYFFFQLRFFLICFFFFSGLQKPKREIRKLSLSCSKGDFFLICLLTIYAYFTLFALFLDFCLCSLILLDLCAAFRHTPLHPFPSGGGGRGGERFGWGGGGDKLDKYRSRSKMRAV